MKELFSKYDMCLKDSQKHSFSLFYDFLIEENKKYNLTAITDEKEVMVKHFIDSCLSLSYLKPGDSLIDIGSGAGFPAIPLKIMLPNIHLTLVDSLRKRVSFLHQLSEKLLLSDLECVHARGEDLAQNSKYREVYDVCVARAVAKLNVLCEYCLPFVKLGGLFIAYKSQDAQEELLFSQNAIQLLGGEVKEVKEIDLEGNKRVLIVIQKTKKTPQKYPRLGNKPRIQPL